MVRPRTYKTEAVVLKQTPLGEADRILTFYTQDMGKLRAVAKGVRRTKSRLVGHLELLNNVSVSLSQGRNLDVVTEAQVVHSFAGIRQDLPRLSKAIYIAELVDGFSVEHSSGYTLYRLLLNTLAHLDRAERPDLLLRHFEMHLLALSGFRPELYSCVECRSTLEPADHLFSCANGGVLCPNCRVASGQALLPISINAMKVLRYLLREEDYAKVAGLKVSLGLLREIERMVRTYVRFLAERELKSAEFMNLVSSDRARTNPA